VNAPQKGNGGDLFFTKPNPSDGNDAITSNVSGQWIPHLSSGGSYSKPDPIVQQLQTEGNLEGEKGELLPTLEATITAAFEGASTKLTKKSFGESCYVDQTKTVKKNPQADGAVTRHDLQRQSRGAR